LALSPAALTFSVGHCRSCYGSPACSRYGLNFRYAGIYRYGRWGIYRYGVFGLQAGELGFPHSAQVVAAAHCII
jgi:hypothetical protein